MKLIEFIVGYLALEVKKLALLQSWKKVSQFTR